MAPVQRGKMPIAITLATLVVSIATQGNIPSTLADRVTREADAIWSPAGVTFLWNRRPVVAASGVNVLIGPALGTRREPGIDEPLGWILFENGQPTPEIYLSYANAVDLLQSSRGVVGSTTNMPPIEREIYVGRALGRALAHELGHYLLGSKMHTQSGLMRATRNAYEFFSAEHTRFAVTHEERLSAEARLAAERVADAAPTPAPAPARTMRRRASPHS